MALSDNDCGGTQPNKNLKNWVWDVDNCRIEKQYHNAPCDYITSEMIHAMMTCVIEKHGGFGGGGIGDGTCKTPCVSY